MRAVISFKTEPMFAAVAHMERREGDLRQQAEQHWAGIWSVVNELDNVGIPIGNQILRRLLNKEIAILSQLIALRGEIAQQLGSKAQEIIQAENALTEILS